MRNRSLSTTLLISVLATVLSPALRAQDEPRLGTKPVPARPDQAALIAAQRSSMASLAFMDGAWRGKATTVSPDGGTHVITQTERVGPFLDGSIKVIEGRGYDDDGKVAFNAFGIVSYDPATQAYRFHSYAMGMQGDYSFKPTDGGYVWEIPAGPMTIRYTAMIRDGAWNEIGEQIVPGRPAERFFEMNLRRIGDSDWPEAGALQRQ